MKSSYDTTQQNGERRSQALNEFVRSGLVSPPRPSDYIWFCNIAKGITPHWYLAFVHRLRLIYTFYCVELKRVVVSNYLLSCVRYFLCATYYLNVFIYTLHIFIFAASHSV